MLFKFFPLFIFLLYVGCVNKIEHINSSFSEKKITDFGIDVEISYYLKGQLEFQLIAPEIEQISEPIKQNIFSQGIIVYIYNSSLDTIASIFSDFAIQNKQDNLVEAKKNVVLKNIQNEQLNTESLFWDKNTKTIYTDDFVTINTKNEIIMGYGFVTDQSFSTYSLSNITGTIYL